MVGGKAILRAFRRQHNNNNNFPSTKTHILLWPLKQHSPHPCI